LALLAGCAPTSLAPSIIRLPPYDAGKREVRLGVRSGPRLSAAISNMDRGLFNGDGGDLDVPNWSLAYDLSFTWPMNDVLALHAGGEGEFYYPIPVPAVGGWGGVSALWRKGRFGFAPALAVRLNTTLGLAPAPFFNANSPGTGELVSADASCTLSAVGDELSRVALSPFVSVSYLPGHATPGPVWYVGGVFVFRVKKAEVLGGVARVILPDGRNWNVPLVGLRAGEN